MRCENYMANKVAFIVAQVIECSILGHGIFFPCLIITIMDNQKL